MHRNHVQVEVLATNNVRCTQLNRVIDAARQFLHTREDNLLFPAGVCVVEPAPGEAPDIRLLRIHAKSTVCSLDAQVQFFPYLLNEQDPEEEFADEDDQVVACQQWMLPSNTFEGLWESYELLEMWLLTGLG
jgi:hypothetical protein